jgi:spore maturation protein CgeB
MNFMRGRMVTPSATPAEKGRAMKSLLARHSEANRSRDHHIDGYTRAAATATPDFDAATLLSPPHSLLGYKPPEARPKLKIVILGLSITSSRGNDHGAIYRGLIRELAARGHDVLFLERAAEQSAPNGDVPSPTCGRMEFYGDVKDLKQRFGSEIRGVDFVMVGSCVQEGIAIGEWVTRVAKGATAFYDIDAPATMANLIRGEVDYISSTLIPRYEIYLSFTGGSLLRYIEKHYGSPMARPLYASVDATLYFPEQRDMKWDLGYMGNYSDDRQRTLDRLLLEPARRWGEGHFVVAGPQYPRSVHWPHNVRRLTHLAPEKHRSFYNSQRFTLNITRANLTASGFSPSAHIFEAAACGTPIISDFWQGIDTFFKSEEEILISHSPDETLIYLEEISELDRRRIGYRARERVLAKHTSRHRAAELESYAFEVLKLSA